MNRALPIIRSTATALLIVLAACGGGNEPEPEPPLERNDPVRDWTFSLYSSSASTGITRSVVSAQDGSGTQTGGLMEKLVGFGPTGLIDDELFAITEVIPPDGQANGLIFSTADGKTFGAFAEAPFGKLGGINQPGGPNPIGGNASLLQRQSYIKRAADATLSYTLSDVFICAYDYNLFPPTFGTDDAHTQIRGAVVFSILAWTSQTQTKRTFFSVAGGAAVVGTRNLWGRFVEDFADGFSFTAWEEKDFDFIVGPRVDVFGNGTQACLELNTELTYPIDLSSIAVGEEFTVQSIAEADAINKRGGGAINDHQASAVSAYLRDPVSIGGTTVRLSAWSPPTGRMPCHRSRYPLSPRVACRGPAPIPTRACSSSAPRASSPTSRRAACPRSRSRARAAAGATSAPPSAPATARPPAVRTTHR